MYANAPSIGTIKGSCQIPLQYIVINTQSSHNGALKDSCPVVEKYDAALRPATVKKQDNFQLTVH